MLGIRLKANLLCYCKHKLGDHKLINERKTIHCQKCKSYCFVFPLKLNSHCRRSVHNFKPPEFYQCIDCGITSAKLVEIDQEL